MLVRVSRLFLSCLLLQSGFPAAAEAEPAAPAAPAAAASQADAQDATSAFTTPQLDALLAPIALYPDELLTQTLIASTFPLQIVAASRWLEDPANSNLKGDALTKALEAQPWDPSVKSLVPFPQVLSQLNANLEWTEQLGYAFANQQKEVMDSVQRLRRQAQAEGNLKSTPQQAVLTQETAAPAAPSGVTAGAGAPSPAPPSSTIVIQPADPNVVYVPTYNPTTVYGAWPYPAYPPVAAYPAPAYVPGTALLSGLAFGAGVAITAGLWGWSSANWRSGDVYINANRWNNINANRTHTASNTWSPALNRTGGRQTANLSRPPSGPVGRPGGGGGLPANAIGRPSVRVPGDLVNRPKPAGGGLQGQNRPNLNPGSRPGAERPAGGQGQRPGGGQVQRPGGGQRPSGGQAQRPANRPAQLPARTAGQGGGIQRPATQPGGALQRPQGGGLGQRPGNLGAQRQGPAAFGGMGEGNRAAAFGQRGAQSRQFGGGGSQFAGRAGGGFQGGGMQRGGGGARAGGGGGFRGGGGGGRGGRG